MNEENLVIYYNKFNEDKRLDSLSQEEIKIISTTYPAHLITEKLVETAITNTAILRKFKTPSPMTKHPLGL